MGSFHQSAFAKNQSLKEFSNRNLRNRSFIGQELNYCSFSGSDLRGVDFSGSDLSGVDFSNAKTGIPPFSSLLIFFFALIVSAFSGYIAMLAGATIQSMLRSSDQNVRIAGVLAIGLVVFFIVYSYIKGGRKAVFSLFVPVVLVSIVLALFFILTGAGTGLGMFYMVLALILTAIMFIVGTIARVAAGSLSNILFFVVAITGGFFGRTVGGELGTVIMAISCALISKKALKGAPGFEFLQKLAVYITARWGTSFRKCKMANADFTGTKALHNVDFTEAETALTLWGNCKKINCVFTKKKWQE